MQASDFQKLGYFHYDLGPGCFCWIKKFPNGNSICISDENGTDFPNPEGPFLISIYHKNSEDNGASVIHEISHNFGNHIDFPMISIVKPIVETLEKIASK